MIPLLSSIMWYISLAHFLHLKFSWIVWHTQGLQTHVYSWCTDRNYYKEQVISWKRGKTNGLALSAQCVYAQINWKRDNFIWITLCKYILKIMFFIPILKVLSLRPSSINSTKCCVSGLCHSSQFFYSTSVCGSQNSVKQAGSPSQP